MNKLIHLQPTNPEFLQPTFHHSSSFSPWPQPFPNLQLHRKNHSIHNQTEIIYQSQNFIKACNKLNITTEPYQFQITTRKLIFEITNKTDPQYPQSQSTPTSQNNNTKAAATRTDGNTHRRQHCPQTVSKSLNALLIFFLLFCWINQQWRKNFLSLFHLQNLQPRFFNQPTTEAINHWIWPFQTLIPKTLIPPIQNQRHPHKK